MTSACDLGPLRGCLLLGDTGLVFGVRSRPQHGTGYYRRSSRGAPGAWKGYWEMRRGQRRTDGTGESPSSTWDDKTTLPACCLSVSRHAPQGCKRRVRPATPCQVSTAAQCSGALFAPEHARASGFRARPLGKGRAGWPQQSRKAPLLANVGSAHGEHSTLGLPRAPRPLRTRQGPGSG
jgi:hypothetical protein